MRVVVIHTKKHSAIYPPNGDYCECFISGTEEEMRHSEPQPYYMGAWGPNYPVPTIPTKVHFHISGLVSVISGGKRKWFNLYEMGGE